MAEDVVLIDTSTAPVDELVYNLLDRTEAVREKLSRGCHRLGYFELAATIEASFDPVELGQAAMEDALDDFADGVVSRAKVQAAVRAGIAAGFMTALVQDIGMCLLAPNEDDTVVYDEDDEEDVPTEEVTRG